MFLKIRYLQAKNPVEVKTEIPDNDGAARLFGKMLVS
jgi:hypothetical protein